MPWKDELLQILILPTGATSGARIVIDGTTSQISIYDSTGALVGVLNTDGITWSAANGSIIKIDPTGVFGGAEIDITPPTLAAHTWVPAIIGGDYFDSGGIGQPVVYVEGPNDTGKSFAETQWVGEGDTDPLTYTWFSADKVTVRGAVHAGDLTGGFYYSPEPWRSPSFVNNWGNGAGTVLKYRRLAAPADAVQIIGSVHSPNPFVSTTIFTLPAGYRPANTQRFMVTRDIASFDQCSVTSAGVVAITNTTPGIDWYFDTIIQTDI